MAYQQNPDVWAAKFKQEGWTFAFGSMMQAYAQITSSNKNLTASKPKDDKLLTLEQLEQFEADAYVIYRLAKRMCAEAVDEAQAEKAKVAGVPEDVEILTD